MLYIVATPIGNLSDITLRALDVLRSVDLIACEDTRQTKKLLSRYQINRPLTSYYEYNKLSKGDYLLSLKGNQGTLHEDVQLYFESKQTCPAVGHETYDGEHGRFEKRTVFASSDIDWLKDFHPKWAGLKSIVAVTAERETAKKTSCETRYFISSLDATDPKRLVPLRGHGMDG